MPILKRKQTDKFLLATLGLQTIGIVDVQNAGVCYEILQDSLSRKGRESLAFIMPADLILPFVLFDMRREAYGVPAFRITFHRSELNRKTDCR